MPTSSMFVKRLAALAQQQYDKYHLQHEHDPQLSQQIQKYWADLGFTFPGVQEAWSAVFVSWCIKSVGATAAEFRFDPMHSVFVRWAIRNAQTQTGLFRAFAIEDYAPSLGDIIHNNRGGNSFDFQHAKTHSSYPSHSALVVETGQDAQGNYLLTVGGNESDSVGMKLVRLDNQGRIKQRQISPYICVIQDLK